MDWGRATHACRSAPPTTDARRGRGRPLCSYRHSNRLARRRFPCDPWTSVALAGVASASNVHFEAPSSQPSFTDNGLTLNASGVLAGLGNQDILVTLSATGNPTATCTNPAGANRPPGQNPGAGHAHPQRGHSSERDQERQCVVLGNHQNRRYRPSLVHPGCPNSMWAETITDVSFTSATVTVQQPPGRRC